MKPKLLWPLLLLAGCQSPTLVAPDMPDSATSKPAKLVVYRESMPEIGQGDLYFGEGGKSYAVFSDISSKEFSLSPGKHAFEFTSKGAASFRLDLVLAAGSSTCVRAYTNGTNAYGRYIFPLLRNLASEYQAEVFACPAPAATDDNKPTVQ